MPTQLETLFTNIANAIRSKGGTTAQIPAVQFPELIDALGGTFLDLTINSSKSDTSIIISEIEAPVDSVINLSSKRLVSDQYSLYGWEKNEELVSQDTNYNLVVTNDPSNVKAIYDIVYTVILTPTASGAATITGAGKYKASSQVTLIISNISKSYIFDGWYESNILLSNKEIYQFVIQKNMSIQVKLISSIAANLIASGDTEALRSGSSQTLQVKSTSALGTNYHSKYTGAQINEAIKRAFEYEEK